MSGRIQTKIDQIIAVVLMISAVHFSVNFVLDQGLLSRFTTASIIKGFFSSLIFILLVTSAAGLWWQRKWSYPIVTLTLLAGLLSFALGSFLYYVSPHLNFGFEVGNGPQDFGYRFVVSFFSLMVLPYFHRRINVLRQANAH